MTSTWQRVSLVKDEAADLFYRRLFEIAPQVRPLFPEDLKEQKRKLMAMLATAVGGLGNIEALIGPLKELGARHVNFGTKDSDYEAVASALVWTLDRSLGPAFTPDVKDAWVSTYQVLAEVMQSGAAEVRAAALGRRAQPERPPDGGRATMRNGR